MRLSLDVAGPKFFSRLAHGFACNEKRRDAFDIFLGVIGRCKIIEDLHDRYVDLQNFGPSGTCRNLSGAANALAAWQSANTEIEAVPGNHVS